MRLIGKFFKQQSRRVSADGFALSPQPIPVDSARSWHRQGAKPASRCVHKEERAGPSEEGLR
jgi:hypothetical protein